MKLDGLNMSNSVKAGTQQRANPLSTKDSAKESFKDVLGKSEHPKSQTQQAKHDEPHAKAQRQATVAPRPTTAARRQTPAKPTGVENLDDNNRQEVSADTGEMVYATEAGAEGIPGAPDPSSGMKATPDLPFAMPSMMAVNSPLANKSKDVTADSRVDSLTRRAVWSDFLRKMNEELGVDAESVLAAFSTLTEKELAAPPEQNVDKLVMALGLNPEQNVLAQKMFTDLIGKTQSKSLAEELENSSSTINLSLMSQRDMQRRQLQTALDKMNSAFFMSAQGKMAAKTPQEQNNALAANGSVLAPELGEEYSQTLAPMMPSAAAASLPELSTPMATAPLAAPATSAAASAKGMNKLVEQMEPMTDDEIAEFTQAMSKNNAQMYAHAPKMKMFSAPAAAAAAPAATSASSGASEGAQMTAKALAEALGLSSAGEGSKSGDAGAQEEGADSSMLSQTLNADRNIQAPKSDAKFQLSPMESKQAPEQMSVPDLINNARVMIRDGGGEMKVSLTPEGMGEVNMKVSVENGRVNVEMITESDTAKKLIEKGLVDLKANLQANNLSLDSIKIDTASNLGKQLEQQYQDAQRQQAHNFLENFRQNDQGWRRENFMTPSAQMGKSQSQAGATGATPYPSSKRSGAATRRLDLVA